MCCYDRMFHYVIYYRDSFYSVITNNTNMATMQGLDVDTVFAPGNIATRSVNGRVINFLEPVFSFRRKASQPALEFS